MTIKQSNNSLTDEALMELFKNGDIKGFNLLVERYQKPIINYIYRLTGNFMMAEDITQEVFILIYKKAKLFRAAGCFKSWIYKIATNLFNYEMRRRKHTFSEKPIYTEEPTTVKNDLVPEHLNPSQKAENSEIQKRIIELIDSLPHKQRIVVTLHIFEELKQEEIANIVGCSIGTVKSRIYYGLKKLKEQIIESDLLPERR